MQIKVIKTKPPKPTTCKRVAAYARVSREDVSLAHSLDAQIEHYTDLIQANPEWEFAGVYSDSFLSGTTTSRRDGFRQLINECESGRVDIILCKSISRFSRNTVDLLNVCRHLKNIGVDIQFEKESIATISADGELILSLLASFAQEESRSISENVKWGIRKGFLKGKGPHYNLYGYRYDGKKYHIIPEEAAIIRRIYDSYLDGISAEKMEKQFAEEGVLSPRGAKRFSSPTIRRILTNVTYTGNSILQREYIEDHITHKRRKNNGELDRYLVEGTHPVIIPQEKFDSVQEEIQRRKRKRKQGGQVHG